MTRRTTRSSTRSSRSAPPIALTIAGSDPSGGAGLQADLKTFHRLGVYGEAVVTLLTVQNTQRVDAVLVVDATLVGRQIDAVLDDLPPAAVKTGDAFVRARANAAIAIAKVLAATGSSRAKASKLISAPMRSSSPRSNAKSEGQSYG